MSKFNKSLVSLIICLSIFWVTASAQYLIQDSDVVVINGIITECVTDTSDWGTSNITIPSSLDGQTVTSIGIKAFSAKGITNLILLNGIEEVSAWAFYSNPIISVNLPNSVVKIKNGAFEHCSLTKIALPNSIEYIGSSVFGYNSIDSIKIPKSITFLGKSIFQHNSLKHVEFEEGSNIRLIDERCFYDGGYSSLSSIILPVNSNLDINGYKDLQGNNYSEGDAISDFTGIYYADLPPHILTSEDVEFDDNIIIDYSASYTNIIIPSEIGAIAIETIHQTSFDYKMLIEVTIEEGITLIDYNAFANSHIKKLSLPNTLSEIRSGAFMNNSIDTLLMPNSVSTVGGSAFSNNALKYVEISEKLDYIGANLFENNLLDSIIIPDNITSIREDAFRSNSLVKLEIPETVTSIGSGAFANNLLSEVFMHNNITSVGDFAFANNNIDTIALSNRLTEISEGLFENNAIDTLIIPHNTQAIGDSAFYGNSLLDISIPNRVNYVGKKAFADNSGLTVIELPDTVIKEGFTFNNWQNNGDSSMVSSILDFDVSYEALFTINIYNVIFTSGVNGKLQGDSVQTVEHAKEATEIKAVPNSGYHFAKWQNPATGDSVTNRNPITLSNIGSDTALAAVFVKNITNSVIERNNVEVCMYPNPVIDFLEIKSPTAINSIEIINIAGLRKYYNDRVNKTSIIIDMKNLTSGVYFIVVKGENIYNINKILVNN